jgi:hypothetical protein
MNDIKINVRQMCNLEILKAIEETIEKYPQLRFGQILMMLNIVEDVDDPIRHLFYEESYDTYTRMENKDER